MNSPIDIVVTYVNNQDPVWQDLFLKYQKEECQKGITEKSNLQSFGKERFRDWDTLKYWFRSVEKNCPWVNKIFLLVSNETQVPGWINKNNPKLRIVYHKDFIPNDLLPVFNSRPIELFTCNIKDLSNNYIRCNDDCYFMNLIPENMFFEDDKPKLPNNTRPVEYFNATGEGAAFWQTLNNNLDLERQLFPNMTHSYGLTHLQMACSKDNELKFLNSLYSIIYEKQKYSKFRNKYQNSIFLYDNLIRLSGNAIIDDDMYKNSGYFYLKPDLDYKSINKKQCVCINDTNKADKDYELIKKSLIDFFESKFPEKSSFEKEG